MKTWEGLGYYSRARNLHTTAKYVAQELGGQFPNNYNDLLKLKGIGPYTAAAIASIAFNEAVAVLDGNVYRFVSRYFGVDKDIADNKNRKYFLEILDELIPNDNPAVFNQAMMEFGATVCKPAPECEQCIFRESCFAFLHIAQQRLPVKSKKVTVKEQFIYYLIYHHGDKTLMKRRDVSIWNGLFEFPSQVADQAITDLRTPHEHTHGVKLTQTYDPIKHLLTHRKLWVTFIDLEVEHEEDFKQISKDSSFNIYSWEEVLTLPLPKVITNHLQRVGF